MILMGRTRRIMMSGAFLGKFKSKLQKKNETKEINLKKV